MLRVKIERIGESEWHGYIDGQYFDRWYNRTELDLFINSLRRMFDIAELGCITR